MGLAFWFSKKILKITLYFLLFAAIIVLVPNLPPYTAFTKIEIEPPQPQVGPLAINDALNKAEKLYLNKLLGPEAFALYNGEVYTSLATGEIVKLSPGGHKTFVTKIGQPCSDITQEHICGRPLGFVIDQAKNHMYVADAYHGIWKVDLKTDKKQLLVSPRVEIHGRAPKIFNHIAVDRSGNIYWTDSSSDFPLKDGAYTLFADPSGRLMQYDAVRNESKVLLDKLWFANGLAVSPDDQFVVTAETFGNKIHKYYINGPKKGKSEIFVAGLPGTPDNIQVLPDGSGFLVSLYMAIDDESPMISRSLAATPLARKFLARLHRLVEIPFEFLNQQYPHIVFETILYKIGHFRTFSGLSKTSGLVQLDWDGNIVASYYNTDGSMVHLSDVIVFNDKLLMGSPHSSYIGSIPAPPLLKKAFSVKASQQKIEKKSESPKPTQGKPVEQPKTTTAKVTSPPAKATPPPAKTTPPPAKATPPPVKTTSPPVKETPTPVRTTPPPAKVTTPPPAKVTTPPPAKVTTPPHAKVTTPPPAKVTTPPLAKVTTPPPTKTTPPPTKVTPPPAKTTPPQPKTTPPQDKAIPSPVKQTPPQDKTTPPQPKATPPPPKISSPPVKETTKQPEAKAPAKSTQEKVKPETPVPQQIPIKEDIPSDTRKPTKETLKVIKKDGPTEIPNPEL